MQEFRLKKKNTPKTALRKRPVKYTSNSSELIDSFRILRKPAFFYPLFLLEHFFDAPEGRESEYAQQRSNHNILRAKRSYDAADAEQKENPPTFGAQMIFGFYNYGMKQSDNDKCTDADDKTRQMIFVQEIHYCLLLTIS